MTTADGVSAELTPCDCPEGPCEHYPYPCRGSLLVLRRGESRLPRWKEVYYLQRAAARHGAPVADLARRKAKAAPKPCNDRPKPCCGSGGDAATLF